VDRPTAAVNHCGAVRFTSQWPKSLDVHVVGESVCTGTNETGMNNKFIVQLLDRVYCKCMNGRRLHTHTH